MQCCCGTRRPSGEVQLLLDKEILQPKKAGPWRSFLSDVAVWTQPAPPSAAIAMLVSPCSCSEELLAWAGANPELGVASPVAME
ncbi:cortexin-1 isoform 2-T2 [Morphnus guianensis]